MSSLLELKSVGCDRHCEQPGEQPIFTDVNLLLNEGDILVLQGKSGSGYVHDGRSWLNQHEPTVYMTFSCLKEVYPLEVYSAPQHS